MSGIKTGNKGFVNPADGKVYRIDQVPVGEDGVNTTENLQLIDPGDMRVDQTVKDLGKKTKLTLGTYLSNLTKGEVGSSKGTPNQYSVDVPTNDTQEFSISNEKGYPQQLAPSQNSQNFDDNLQSSLSENYPGIKDAFKKGKSDQQVPDGHTLVKDVNGNGSPVPAYVDNAVKLNEFKHKDGETFLSSGVDPTNPLPANFHPKINKVSQLGKYAGNLGETVDKDIIMLEDLRSKPSEITRKNQFPIDDKIGELSSITDASGYPSAIDATLKNDSFYTRGDGDGADPMAPWKDPLVAEDFNKGKGAEGFNGNNLLLKNIPGNLNISDRRATYPSGIPDENGSYAGNDMFGSPLEGPGVVGVKNDHPLVVYKGARGGTLDEIEARGRWAPGGKPLRKSNKPLRLSNGTEVRQLQMAQVGHALMQRASGEIVNLETRKLDPTAAGAAAGAAFLPGVVQLGAPVSTEILTAKDAFDSVEGEYPPTALTSTMPFASFGDGLAGTSWGAANSPEDPYEDTMAVGSLLTFAALYIANVLLLLVFGLIGNKTSTSTNNKKKYVLGRYYTEGSLNVGKKILSALGINLPAGIHTEEDYQNAMYTGFVAFFLGAKEADTDFKGFLGFWPVIKKIGSEGFVLNSISPDKRLVCRSMVRSLIYTANQAANIAESPNVIQGARRVTKVLGAMSNNRFILGMNIFANLGASILKQKNEMIYVIEPWVKKQELAANPNGISTARLVVDEVTGTTRTHFDTMADPNTTFQSSVKKHRLDGPGFTNDLTLTWSTKRAPAMYLVPKSIVELQSIDIVKNRLGTFSGGLGLSLYRGPDSNSRAIYSTPGDKSKDGRFTQDQLSKFERWLDGEYVPFYFHDIRTNEVISFHAFLTSLDDSYSASYESVDGFGRVEPIKIYKNTTRKIGISFIVAATSDDDFNHMWYKINKLLTLIYPQYTAGRTMSGNMEMPGRNTASYNFKAPFSQLIGASPVIRIRLGDLFRSNYSRFALARLFGLADGDTSIPTSEQLDNGGVSDAAGAPKTAPAAVAAESNVASPGRIGAAFESVVDFLANKLPSASAGAPATTGDTAQTKTALEIDNGEAARYDQMDAFFNADNAIVKSFESTAGKGLAGVIESMNFDWYNQTTWQTQIVGEDANSIAPKMCKITISFSPIHDISPGIDHLGYNRAPVYPVGLAMANRGRSLDQ